MNCTEKVGGAATPEIWVRQNVLFAVRHVVCNLVRVSSCVEVPQEVELPWKVLGRSGALLQQTRIEEGKIDMRQLSTCKDP